MGLFDSIKKFVGVTGIKIEITRIENPFPFTDSVYKGYFEITSPDSLTLVSKKTSLVAKRQVNNNTETLVLVEDSTTDPYNLQDTYPYSLKGGETFQDGSVLIRVDLAEALSKWNITDAKSAKANGIKFFFKVEIDVKETGFAFDPDQEKEFEVID